MPDTWRSIRARKLAQRESRIPSEWRLHTPVLARNNSLLHVPRDCGLLNAEELELTEAYDATALVALLASGELKSETVTTAFCKRAAIAQQATNCLTEILFDDALARAKELDAHLASTGTPLGPLHGLPISLKDSFMIKGYDSSVGVANLCFKPATANAALVDQLVSLGAVLYCKTNVPQSMMALDSDNNVFGRTLNPANLKLTAGGSSGGEGALIAMRGSVLGVGTDIGGSIRIPAACNRLFGIKPSHGRVPFAGQEGGYAPGFTKLGIEPTAGPLAVSLRDCEMFLRIVGDGILQVPDPEVVPQTWQQQPGRDHATSPLRIGVIRTDGHVAPLPPIERLMNEVASTLQSSQQRIEIVEVDASSVLSRILKPFNGIMSIDGANSWFDHFEATSEPLSPWLSSRLTRRPPKTTQQIWDLQGQRLALHHEFRRFWAQSGQQIDAMICPVAPHPIPLIDRWNTVNYTGAFNLLDLPGGIIPVRTFNEADLAGEVPSSPPLNGWDKTNREMWTHVDRRDYLGGALSIQVVAPRLRERTLVEVMTVLDEALSPLRQKSQICRGRRGLGAWLIPRF